MHGKTRKNQDIRPKPKSKTKSKSKTMKQEKKQTKMKMNFKTYFPSEKEKQNIQNILNPIDRDKIKKEFAQLKAMGCKGAREASALTRVGNNIVDCFTGKERLHTKGHQQIDFYTFWHNRDYYRTVPYIKKMLVFYESRNVDEMRKFKYIFNLYFSSISIFRPIVSMEVYCRVKATKVLDFTMGWGGRLVGACALGLESYIGIDSNKHLEKPYKEMVSFLKSQEEEPQATTDIKLYFKDATKFDYSTVKYDCVFTSPPYYDLEVYRNQSSSKRDKETWHNEFYFPVFKETWKHLQNNGHYCLNVPVEIYKDACIPILGKCSFKIPLKKKERTGNHPYKEFIYVWKKMS